MASAASAEAPAPTPSWLPLESNPEVLNPFVKRLDLPDGYGFCDVFGLDDEPQQNSRRQRPRRFRTGTSPYSVWEFRK
jgi:hypothetical protein